MQKNEIGSNARPMYLNLNTDDPERVTRAIRELIESPESVMITVKRTGEFYDLSFNTAIETLIHYLKCSWLLMCIAARTSSKRTPWPQWLHGGKGS